jgi:hypothetical protein
MEPERRNEIADLFATIIKSDLSADNFRWLEEKAQAISEEKTANQLNLAFVAVPRKTGRHPLNITPELTNQVEEIHHGFSLQDWTIDRLVRVWLLMQVNEDDQTDYISKIQNLFKAAEMNELVALYSSLCFLQYPEQWSKQCAEGVRSNIGIVLEAIMYNNPYPYQYLTDQAWNQLVLKAFFTEKNINRIIGLDERANQDLANILIDYANERWAAHRPVPPQLWRLVSKFIDDSNFYNIEKAFESSDPSEKKAAALACYQSNYQRAKQLVDTEPSLKSEIMNKQLSWSVL